MQTGAPDGLPGGALGDFQFLDPLLGGGFQPMALSINE